MQISILSIMAAAAAFGFSQAAVVDRWSKALGRGVGAVARANEAGKVIKVVVGSTDLNKSLAYTPNTISAAKGDIVQFQFSMRNHTVTQSTFAEPCQPVANFDKAAAAVNSGFVSVAANQSTVQTFNMTINSTAPMFLYCAQATHCQLGMVMTINAAGDGNQTFAAYKEAAAKATQNIPAAGEPKGGVIGSIPSAEAVPPPV